MWLDADQDVVHAWLAAQRKACPRCGTFEEDWVDLVTRRLLDEPKWAATPFRCPGCSEIERVHSEVPAGERGVRVVLLPAELAEREDDGEG